MNVLSRPRGRLLKQTREHCTTRHVCIISVILIRRVKSYWWICLWMSLSLFWAHCLHIFNYLCFWRWWFGGVPFIFWPLFTHSRIGKSTKALPLCLFLSVVFDMELNKQLELLTQSTARWRSRMIISCLKWNILSLVYEFLAKLNAHTVTYLRF